MVLQHFTAHALNPISTFTRTVLLTVAGQLAGPCSPHNRLHSRDKGLHHPPAVCDDAGEGSQGGGPVYNGVIGESGREGGNR